jgi:hypothetical protein
VAGRDDPAAMTRAGEGRAGEGRAGEGRAGGGRAAAGVHGDPRLTVDGMNFYRLKNGRMTDIWTQFDGVAMNQQLGAIPA